MPRQYRRKWPNLKTRSDRETVIRKIQFTAAALAALLALVVPASAAETDDTARPASVDIEARPVLGEIEISAISLVRTPVTTTSGPAVEYTFTYDGPRPHIDYLIDDTDTGCIIRFIGVTDTAREV